MRLGYAIALHGFEYAPPAPLIGDVVGYEVKPFIAHVAGLNGLFSTRQVMRVARQLTQQEPRQQPGLHQQHPAHADPIAENRVGRVLRQAALEGRHETAAARLGE